MGNFMAELQLSNEQAAVIGLKIRESRLQLGLQQKDLVQGQFSKSYISLIESGRVVPSYKALKVIAARLGVSVETLVNMATPGQGATGQSDGEAEVFGRWDLLLDEARVNLFQKSPEAARNVLLNKIKTRQLSSDQLKHYHFLMGSSFVDSADLEMAIAEFKTALQMAQSLGDSVMQARVTHKLGNIYSLQTKYMLSLENFRKALDLINSLPVQDMKFKLQVLSSLGDCYRSLGDNEHSVQYYSEAMTLASELQDCHGVAAMSWRVSNQFRENNNVSQARAYAAKSIAIYEALDSMHDLIGSKIRLGVMLIDRQDHENSEKYLTEALELSRKMGEDQLAAVAGLNLAQLYCQTNRPDKALQLAAESVENAKASEDKATVGQAMARLAQAHNLKNDPEKSREIFMEAIEQLKDTAVPDVLAQTYFEYGQVLSQLGRTEDALRAMETAYNLQTGVSRLTN
jgi:tetratricopeptide (TPR) repeat protein